ncbi:DUF421 domain-containing protein [Candidatus Laterigemmans baculatus]|uniref:DUF421 domain-containing protein n=1 Tax=Candidatus Laterigemmans baculatus TaxID=2770505 RepID=UPI0013DAA2B5|nr:YetF domain-containing protein [Candidatus Laterigemmans baculatus]
MDKIFFNGWEGINRTLLIGVLAYVVLVFFLRISGRRTLSKMNAFDLVVTVALGSTLATILLNQQVALAEGAVAFAVLIGLQFIVTWSSVRTKWVRRVVTGDPVLLLYRGEMLRAAMRQARVTDAEIHAAIRSAGAPAVGEIEAVVLETDGSFSVIRQRAEGGDSSLAGVQSKEKALP